MISKLFKDKELILLFIETYFRKRNKDNTPNCNEYFKEIPYIRRVTDAGIFSSDVWVYDIIYYHLLSHLLDMMTNPNLKEIEKLFAIKNIEPDIAWIIESFGEENLISMLLVLSKITKDNSLIVRALACILARTVSITTKIQTNPFVEELIEDLPSIWDMDSDEIEFLLELFSRETDTQVHQYEVRLVIFIYTLLKEYRLLKDLILPNLPKISSGKPADLYMFISSESSLKLIESIAFEEGIDYNSPIFVKDFSSYLINTYFYNATIYKFLEHLPFLGEESIENYYRFLKDLSKNLKFELRKLLLHLEKENNKAFANMEYNLSYVDSGQEFEIFCAQLFESLGFKTKTTPISKDQGADLLLLNPETGKNL